MKAKAMLLLGGVAGYVLGTRDGRVRYEQIKARASQLWSSPQVQQARTHAQEAAADAASKVAQTAKNKIGDQPVGGAHA